MSKHHVQDRHVHIWTEADVKRDSLYIVADRPRLILAADCCRLLDNLACSMCEPFLCKFSG